MKALLLLALFSSPVADEKLNICEQVYDNAYKIKAARNSGVPIVDIMRRTKDDTGRYFVLAAYAGKFEPSQKFAEDAYIQCMMKLEKQ